MTTVGQRDQGLDAGYLAILGHRLLGSAAAVTGALMTLDDHDHPVSAVQRDRLERMVDDHLASIVGLARSLIRGERP